jgi:TPR repeat protein
MIHLGFGRISLFAFTVVVWGTLCSAADLDSAKRAYEQKDYAIAFKEATPLAEQGNADAQVLLGRMYMRGQGVLLDPDQAIKWLKLSAAQGNADAQFLLGSIYLLPQKDVPEGLKWMRLSAEQGNQDAQYLLGKAYIQGLQGLPRDPIQAEMWLSLAAKDNLEFYQGELANAEKQMSMVQLARGRALAVAWKPKPGLKPEQQPQADDKSGQHPKPKS